MQIKDGWNEFLVEPINKKQLAEKIKYLIGNKEGWEKIIENGQKSSLVGGRLLRGICRFRGA
jgi:hypothetical protein